MLYKTILYYILLCTILNHAILYFTMLCYAILSYAMLCCATLSYVNLLYAENWISSFPECFAYDIYSLLSFLSSESCKFYSFKLFFNWLVVFSWNSSNLWNLRYFFFKNLCLSIIHSSYSMKSFHKASSVHLKVIAERGGTFQMRL